MFRSDASIDSAFVMFLLRVVISPESGDLKLAIPPLPLGFIPRDPGCDIG